MNYFLNASVVSFTTAMLLSITGCGSGGGSNGTPPANATVKVSGNAVDGYLRGANVCYDLNNNLVCDAGEPSDITDINGSFDLTVTPEQQAAASANASLLVSGGIDIDTNLDFVGVLRAPYENTNVINLTPLTTMASAIVASGGSIDDAYQQVADALDLNVSLVAADPVAVAATNPEVMKAAMSVERIVEVLAAADDNKTTPDEINGIYEALADAVAKVADNNTTSGMADIVEAAAADANTTLKPAAVKASAVASIIEDQVAAALGNGYSPDAALVVGEAVKAVEAAVVDAVKNNTTIDEATVEADANAAAAAADPVLIAVKNLLEAYGITANDAQIEAIKTAGGFTESAEVTIASVSALTYATAQSVIDALAHAYKTEQVKQYLTNLGQSVSDTAIAEIVALPGFDTKFDATMTPAAFSEWIYATGNAELMKLALTIAPPAGYATLSDVEQAKALFTELRTQAMSVVDYNNSGKPGYLDTEADSMDTALNGVVLDVNYMGDKFNFMMEGINYAMDNNLTTTSNITFDANRSATLTKEDTTSGNISWKYDINETGTNHTWSGTITYPDIDNINLSASTTLTANIKGTLPLDYKPVTTTGVVDSQSFDGSVTVTKTSTGADISIGGTIASNGDSIVLSKATAEIAYAQDATTGEPIFNYFKLNGFTLVGTVKGYTVNGTLAVNSYAQNTLLKAKGGTYEVNESGFGVNFHCDDNSDPLINNPTFNYNGVSYSPNHSGTYSNGTYNIYDFWFNDIKGHVDVSDITKINNYENISCSNGTLIAENPNNSLYYDSYTDIANSGWLPNDVTFSGTITNTDTSGSINGILNAKWLNVVGMDLDDADQDPSLHVTLNGKLDMPNRPEMSVQIDFKNNVDSNNHATDITTDATYAYDTTGISANGTFDKDMENGHITIKAATTIQVDIAIANGDIDYAESNVTKGGLQLGSVEDRAGVPVIKYIDGTFESLP